MVALSRCFVSSVGLLAASGAEGFRVTKKGAAQGPSTKFIGGVPVLNYDAAYAGGEASFFGDSEEEWVVTLKPEASDTQLEKLCGVARNGCSKRGEADGVAFLSIRGTESDLEEIVGSADLGAVKFIEPDQVMMMIPEMTLKNEAEGTLQDDGPGTQGVATWGLDRIGASNRRSSGQNTYAYVLDTGVRTTHREFGGRARSAFETIGASPRECRGDRNCAVDRQGHGTHCAGTIAGTNLGVAPFANIEAVKVCNDQGGAALSWIISGLDLVARKAKRPAVISMSLQSPQRLPSQENAINIAVNKGITVVVAAGNANTDACGYSPAYVQSVITVGSTEQDNSRSGFSNYGSCVNIFAPGGGVLSASHTSDGGTATKSGTSMACPHMAGAALLQLQKNPSGNIVKTWTPIINNAVRNQVRDVKGSPNALLSVRNL